MLASLRIRNLAIAEDVLVSFGPGLNVITGETGAGKSLLVQALGLVLGERADKSMVRDGADACTVEATFELTEPGEVDRILEDLGLAACEDGRLILRRIVSATGSGKNFVNDASTTLQAFKLLGDVLVDLHGPHDHQSLLSREFQLSVLDGFGHTAKPMAAYGRHYERMRELERQRAELEGGAGGVERELEMLDFQIREIEGAHLDEMAEDELEDELMRVANASRILELSQAACDALSESETSAFRALGVAQRELDSLRDILGTGAEAWLAEARSAAVQVQELANAIAAMAATVEGDPARLEWLETRKAAIRKVKRTYGGTVESAREALAKAVQRRDDLLHRGERLAELGAKHAAVVAELEATGGALRKARVSAAGKLAKAVTTELRVLGFEHGAFAVDLSPCEPTATGMDEVEFGFEPNVGEPMRPLRAIASSGEISRVMLATKAVLALHDRIPVLVFDEVDANLGGTTGHAVGAKLAAVAADHQVLCITHLPQVAVHGDAHFVASKSVSAGRTRTQISPVDDESRVEEVARMLGGRDLTSVTLDHAREMLTVPAARGRAVGARTVPAPPVRSGRARKSR